MGECIAFIMAQFIIFVRETIRGAKSIKLYIIIAIISMETGAKKREDSEDEIFEPDGSS